MAVSFIKSRPLFTRRPFVSSLMSCTLLGLALVLAAGGSAHAQLTNSEISAVYKIKYNGLGLGKLYFNSTVRGRRYKMETSTKLSVPLLSSLFNSMKWRGITRVSGTVHNQRPRPSVYHFAFRSGKKSGTVDMQFSGDNVSHVSRIPDKKLSSAHVQVTPAHLRHVLDPMSALMLISRKGRSHRSACSGTIPIYDGKQRFNLKLSYKRSVRVSRSQSGGYAGPVIVCRVRYQPISGYKPHKKDVKFMIRNRKIEMWLMPLPHSRNYAPYQFVLPLPLGTAYAFLSSFSIRNGRGRQIALVR